MVVVDDVTGVWVVVVVELLVGDDVLVVVDVVEDVDIEVEVDDVDVDVDPLGGVDEVDDPPLRCSGTGTPSVVPPDDEPLGSFEVPDPLGL